MQTAALLVNPRASGVTEQGIHQVHEILARQLALALLVAEWPGHLTELAHEVSNDRSIGALFLYSGDGGFNEALNGLTRRMPLGLIPGGRTNVLPRALGIARDPVVAAHYLSASLVQQRTRQIALGRANGRRFAFAAGVGLDAEFVRAWDHLGYRPDGRRPGDLAFVRAATQVMWRKRWFAPSVLEIVGHGRAAFALVANGKPQSYLGRVPLYFAPEASFQRGLDVVAPEQVTLSSLVAILSRAAIRRAHAAGRRGVYLTDRASFQIICDQPTPMYTDGEDLGDTTAVLFETERNAVIALI